MHGEMCHEDTGEEVNAECVANRMTIILQTAQADSTRSEYTQHRSFLAQPNERSSQSRRKCRDGLTDTDSFRKDLFSLFARLSVYIITRGVCTNCAVK